MPQECELLNLHNLTVVDGITRHDWSSDEEEMEGRRQSGFFQGYPASGSLFIVLFKPGLWHMGRNSQAVGMMCLCVSVSVSQRNISVEVTA